MQHVEKTMENLRLCKCFECPSYTKACKSKNSSNLYDNISEIKEVNHLEIMFCAFEKSDCIHENQGCLCLKCPVHKKYALNNEDYCLTTGGIL